MTKFTKEEANFADYPFDSYGIFVKTSKTLYPCYRCGNWEGQKAPEGEGTTATCKVVDGAIDFHDNCFYFTMFKARPNLGFTARWMKKIVKKGE
jgi:hypothetical protein